MAMSDDELNGLAKAPSAILDQMRDMAELQRLQNEQLAAMQNQLAEEQAKRQALETKLGEQQERMEAGHVHYKMPKMSAEQEWNLLLNDPRGVLG